MTFQIDILIYVDVSSIYGNILHSLVAQQQIRKKVACRVMSGIDS
jgi:hypothetical protein